MIDFENGAIFKLKPDNGKSARHVEDLLFPAKQSLAPTPLSVTLWYLPTSA